MPEFNVRHASRRWLVAGAALITSVGLTAALVSHHDATAQSSCDIDDSGLPRCTMAQSTKRSASLR